MGGLAPRDFGPDGAVAKPINLCQCVAPARATARTPRRTSRRAAECRGTKTKRIASVQDREAGPKSSQGRRPAGLCLLIRLWEMANLVKMIEAFEAFRKRVT